MDKRPAVVFRESKQRERERRMKKELPKRKGPSFKTALPKGKRCSAWVGSRWNYKVRQCLKKAIDGYCEEHRPKARKA